MPVTRRIRKDVAYLPAAASPRHTGDLHLPAGAWRGKVLVIHGGGWQQYAKERMAGVAQRLVDHGYAAFAVNYPLITDRPWPACGEACLAAGRFLRDLVPEGCGCAAAAPLFTLGASAGGHLALMTGLRLDGVAGIVSVAGVTDVAGYASQPGFAGQRRWFVKAFLGTEAPTAAQWRATSPLNHVQAGHLPIFLSHDRNDRVVPIEQAEAMVAASRRVDGEVELYRYDGPGHLMWADPEQDAPHLLPAIEERLLAFLERWAAPCPL